MLTEKELKKNKSISETNSQKHRFRNSGLSVFITKLNS
jgi:hypothetical protein